MNITPNHVVKDVIHYFTDQAMSSNRHVLPSSMADFPENVLLHIFSFLNYEDLCLGVRPVCKRWSRLTFDPTLWRFVDIPQHFSDKRFLALLKVIHKYIEELECSKCENLSDYVFNDLAKLDLMKLKKLAMPIVSSCSDTQFIKLMGACDCLEDVSNIRSNLQEDCNPLYCQLLFPHIKVCYDKPISTYGRIRKIVPAFDQRKMDQWLADLANFGRQRSEQVDTYECIRGTDFLTDDGMETVSKMFPKLRKLDIKQCNFTDEGLKKFFELNTSDTGLIEVAFDKPGNITDKGIKLIADRCPNLRRIKIARAVKVTNEGINYLLVHCSKLESVHLNNNVALYDEPDPDKADLDNSCLETAAVHCKRLESFRLFYSKAVDYIGVEKLAAGCPYLVSLMFFDCPNICDKALDAIMQLKHLKAIILVNCEKLTPKGVIKLILTSSNLLRMTLYCNNVLFYADQSQLADETYELIDAAGTNYRPNVMRKLTLRGVGSGFTQLITVLCPDLHTIDIREANYVTNLALRSVMRNCEFLRSLDVAALTLDEEFLSDLCRLAPNLRHLTLGNALRECDRANDGLAELIRKCRSLSMIGLNNPDRHINEKFIIYMAKKHHGGQCVLHVDPDADEDGKHRFIDLHFTPIKYLGSITTVKFDEDYVELPPKVVEDDDEEDEDVKAPGQPAATKPTAETPLSDKGAEAAAASWVDIPITEDVVTNVGDSKLRVTMDVPFLQAALETIDLPGAAALVDSQPKPDGRYTADKQPTAESQSAVNPNPYIAADLQEAAEQAEQAPPPGIEVEHEGPDRDLIEAQARAEAAVAAATSQGGLANEVEAINDIINFLTLALDDSGRQGDIGSRGPTIDLRFLQSALDTVKKLTSDNRAAEVEPCVPSNPPVAAAVVQVPSTSRVVDTSQQSTSDNPQNLLSPQSAPEQSPKQKSAHSRDESVPVIESTKSTSEPAQSALVEETAQTIPKCIHPKDKSALSILESDQSKAESTPGAVSEQQTQESVESKSESTLPIPESTHSKVQSTPVAEPAKPKPESTQSTEAESLTVAGPQQQISKSVEPKTDAAPVVQSTQPIPESAPVAEFAQSEAESAPAVESTEPEQLPESALHAEAIQTQPEVSETRGNRTNIPPRKRFIE